VTDPALWTKAKQIFDEALALDDSARARFLRRSCANQPELLAEVQSLIGWHRETTGFLEHPAADLRDWPPEADEVERFLGQSVGAWRIVNVIGSGGMGVVYGAERADDAFHRQAALKIVRAGLASPDFVERFRLERKTLAALDHPNIARLLDGGATAAGEPYFVMELVDGIPVDRFADEQRYSIARRLELFRDICRGAQYAHANFVVHRDIKPDNILVTREGVPKLVDFGVAKISGADGGVAGPAEARTWLMTPDYASPEQLGGGAVTMASDVYSLGVLLYVLLSGTRPYRLKGGTPDALRRELAAAPFVPPSQRVRPEAPEAAARAAARATTPRELSRRLSGDLDAIVARALARDPAERYASVEQLADDLERHRTFFPVRARRRDLRYVARQAVRRHLVAVAAVTSVVIVGLGGVALVVRESAIAREARERAERRFEDVRQFARTVIFDVHDAMVNVPGTTGARALMMRTAVAYLSRLDQDAAGDPTLAAELATAFVRVGDAQGHPNSPNIGDTAGALASYRRAIELAERVSAGGPSGDVSRTLAMAHRKLADVLAITGDLDSALTHATTSQRLFDAIGATAGAPVDDRLQAAIAEIKLGDLTGHPNFPNLGRPADSLPRYQSALATLRRLAVEAPDHVRVRRYVGLTLERIGALHENARRWTDALEAYQQSFEIRAALAKTERPQVDVLRDLAVAYEKLGNVQRFTGQRDAALANYRSALEQFVRLASMDPSDSNSARSAAISREKLAAALAEDKSGVTEAATLLGDALAAHRTRASRDSGNVQARCDVARVAEMLGDARAGSTQSCALWKESLDTRRSLAGEGQESCAKASDFSRLTARMSACR
jgi:non-specific serine/threonine protein kinase/serine/threonine-protein kinase